MSLPFFGVRKIFLCIFVCIFCVWRMPRKVFFWLRKVPPQPIPELGIGPIRGRNRAKNAKIFPTAPGGPKKVQTTSKCIIWVIFTILGSFCKFFLEQMVEDISEIRNMRRDVIVTSSWCHYRFSVRLRCEKFSCVFLCIFCVWRTPREVCF